jgi:2-keto-4-pentenoate hydratase/2-oxohepta-3-ene-1,7-dioic acid hydratase in catechol pathway
MELAAIIGKPLPMNQGLTVKETDEHIFGFVTVNDWSCEVLHRNYAVGVLIGCAARDIQVRIQDGR